MIIRVLALRNNLTGNWKLLTIPTKDFEPKHFPGYTFYRSSASMTEALAYINFVEKEEEDIFRA